MKQFTLTNHAVEQFASRWLTDANITSAERELQSLLRTSRQVGRTYAGDSIYVSGHRPEIRMVVKDRNVCVTVLPFYGEDDMNDIELELMQEAYENRKKRDSIEIAELEKQIKWLDDQRDELKQIYKQEIDTLSVKKNELNAKLAKLQRI